MTPNTIERLTTAVAIRRPAFGEILSRYGDLTLPQYTQQFPKNEASPIQPRSEVADAASRAAMETLGPNVARKVFRQLSEVSAVATGPHQGVDYSASTRQGVEVYNFSVDPELVNIVLACANIPLNNPTRPMSIGLASGERINVFTNKYAHHLVAAAPGFTSEMIANALKTTEVYLAEGKLSELEAKTVMDILREDYAGLTGLSYSHQSNVVNHRLWRRTHTEEARKEVPDLAYLEYEAVIKNLLENDLRKPGSMMFDLLFDPKLRSSILKNFSKIAGCWNDDSLQILRDPATDPELKKKALEQVGTVFFWGIDSKGTRYPLILQDNGASTFMVRADREDPAATFEFTPENVLDRLNEKNETGKRILPSLFIAFTEIAFIHGYKCYGGPRQVEYLTQMKSAMVESLEKNGQNEWAEKVSTVETKNYNTGLIVAASRYSNGTVKSAGTVEIATKGGFDTSDLDKIRRLTFSDASLFGMLRYYQKFCSGKDPNLDSLTDIDVANYLDGKLITINL